VTTGYTLTARVVWVKGVCLLSGVLEWLSPFGTRDVSLLVVYLKKQFPESASTSAWGSKQCFWEQWRNRRVSLPCVRNQWSVSFNGKAKVYL